MTKSFYAISLDVDKTFATEEGNDVTLNASTVDLQRGSLFGPSSKGNFACTCIRELCVAKITKAQGFCLSINPCVFFNLSGIIALGRCSEREYGLLAGIFCCKYAKISDGKPTLPAVYEISNNEGIASILVNENAKSFCFSSQTTNRLFLGLRASTVRCVNLIFTTVTHVLGNTGATEIQGSRRYECRLMT